MLNSSIRNKKGIISKTTEGDLLVVPIQSRSDIYKHADHSSSFSLRMEREKHRSDFEKGFIAGPQMEGAVAADSSRRLFQSEQGLKARVWQRHR